MKVPMRVLVQIHEFKFWTCKFAQETYNGIHKAQEFFIYLFIYLFFLFLFFNWLIITLDQVMIFKYGSTFTDLAHEC